MPQGIAPSPDKTRATLLGLELSMCDKFRQLREERGWSQLEISEKLADMGIDMHQTTVAKMERGKRPLRVAEMYALGWIFGLPPGAVFWLPSREGMPPSMATMTEQLAAIDEQQNEMREQFLEVFRSHLAQYSDLDSERAALIRAIREAADPDSEAGSVIGAIREEIFTVEDEDDGIHSQA